MKEISKIITWKGRAKWYFPTATLTTATGKTVRCVARANSTGLMVGTTRGSSSTTRSRVSAGCRCLTDASTRVSGRTEISTDKASTGARTENGRKAFGRMGKKVTFDLCSLNMINDIICKIFLFSLSIGSAAVPLPYISGPSRREWRSCFDGRFSSTCSRTPPLFSSTSPTHSSRSRSSSRSESTEADTRSSSISICYLNDGMPPISKMEPNLTSTSLKGTCHNFSGAGLVISSNTIAHESHSKTQNSDTQQSIAKVKST